MDMSRDAKHVGDTEAGATAHEKLGTESIFDDEAWRSILRLRCTFPPELFESVMLNLVRNPNITSSHLFRADVLFDQDHELVSDQDKLLQQLKPEYRPRDHELAGWTKTRTIVRRLIPRNVQLDKSLLQTCLFFIRHDAGREERLVIYIPHVEVVSEMPFYHPSVARLAFHHAWQTTADSTGDGKLELYYCLFSGTELTDRLSRTGLNLLQTIHKHGQGQLAGYEKRVHHDRIIPQKAFQDTYTRLKVKYAKTLVEKWVEVTDPGKHVFEDISIAAFLIELWRTMYQQPETGSSDVVLNSGNGRPSFPGFVDIGCGNGILTYLLISEGYHGSGFDARRRKTWSVFPPEVQDKLQQRLLVPEVLLQATNAAADESYHPGIFTRGTFIVSNHADELTAWTPLLAYLNDGAFIAIPCCSHDLAGARFRAPAAVKGSKSQDRNLPVRLPQQTLAQADGIDETVHRQAAETGSLKRTLVQKKMASAYATLCSYVESLADHVGFQVETEILRIPSTRNHSIIGRVLRKDVVDDDRQQQVRTLIEDELDRSIESIATEWIERAEKLAVKPRSGH